MGDRHQADKPSQYFTEPPRPTQPPTLSGTGNEYRPKCGDAVQLGSKGSRLIPYVDKHEWHIKLCDTSLTRAKLPT